MKLICKTIVAAALVLAAVITAQAQPYYGFVAQPVVSTTLGTKGVAGTAWTNAIAVATTNVTLVSSAGVKDTALQFNASLTATNASEVTVIWQLARNVSGGTSYELFQKVTNTVAVNTTAAPTVVVNVNKLAIPYIYVYSVTPSAGVATNATVYAAGL